MAPPRIINLNQSRRAENDRRKESIEVGLSEVGVNAVVAVRRVVLFAAWSVVPFSWLALIIVERAD
jgi:hypothetical protein